jgi:rubrerythrin
MAERASPELIQLLETCLAIELAASRLYAVLATAHADNPTISQLWKRTARDEESHAAQFRLAISCAATMLEGASGDLASANQVLQAIEGVAARYAAHPPSVAEALKTAITLEENLVHFHVDRVARFTRHSYEELFRSMMTADAEHVERLREALQAHGGGG